MSPIEIIVIIIAVIIVVVVFGREIYKKIHHKPTDTCEECHERVRNAVRRMKKEQARKKKKALKLQKKQEKEALK